MTHSFSMRRDNTPAGSMRFGRLASLAAVVLLAGLGSTALSQELRTWTDKSGKFKIEAKLVSVEDGTATLEREDGTEVEIPVAKLSAADQKFLAEQEENPFTKKEDDSPFMEKGDKASGGRGPREVTVDWSQADNIPLVPDSDAWQVTIAESPNVEFRPRTTALPAKTHFFDKIQAIAVNPAAKRAAVGYVLSMPAGQASSRLVLCDLQTGKTVGEASSPIPMVPIALHDDGRQVLVRSFGHNGQMDKLEVCSLKGKSIQKGLIFTPFHDLDGWDRDVMWAEFIDEGRLALSSRNGKVAVWDFESGQPTAWFQISNGAVPALSPDRKHIAFCTDKEIGLYDVDTASVEVMTSTPRPLQWPYLAFSPSGKRIGCIAFNQMLAWNVANGELEADVPCGDMHVHGAIAFPHESFLMGGHGYLVDLDNQLKLWEYEGHEQVVVAGGWTFFGVTAGDKPGALVAAQIPHSGALDLLKKALAQSDLFVFQAGAKVKLDVNGIAPAEQQRVRTALTERLQKVGASVDPNGTIELVALTEGPKEREISYINSGDYKVQEYMAVVRFVYQGETIWEKRSSSVPGFIHLRRGENIEGVLRKSETPQYGMYTSVELPKFLQKPSGKRGPGAQQTIGQSKITTTGVR